MWSVLAAVTAILHLPPLKPYKGSMVLKSGILFPLLLQLLIALRVPDLHSQVLPDSHVVLNDLIELFNHDQVEFKKRLRSIKDKNFRKNLLQEYANYIIKGAETKYSARLEENFTTFLKISDQLFPSAKICERYFYGCLLPKAIPSIKGMGLLVDQLKGEHRLGDVRPAPLDKLGKSLHAMIKEAKKAHRPLERGFLIWHGDEKMAKSNPVQVEKHYTPLLVKIVGQEIRVFLPDSVLNIKGKTYSLNLEEKIRELLPQKGYSLKIFQLEKVDDEKESYTARQRDGQSCPIFSICDFEEHHKSSLFDFLEEEEQKGELVKPCNAETGNFVVKALPPDFMKNMQSWKGLEKYLEDYPEWAANDGANLLAIFEQDEEGKMPQSYRTRRLAFELYGKIVLSAIGAL